MKTRFLLVFSVVVLTCAAVWIATAGRRGTPRAARQPVGPPAGDKIDPSLPPPPSGEAVVQAGPPPSPTVLEPAPADPAATPPAPSRTTPDVSGDVAPPIPAPAAMRRVDAPRAGDAPEPLVPKPVARTALGFVGADADAEEVWVNAINDPNRSADERKDLIEDLNEDGFPDPKHITEDDLPLIVSRLMLIEELAPDAIDEVNLAAFQEAYKDLSNMLERLSRN